MIQALRKIGYKSCTCFSRLGLGNLCEPLDTFANFPSILPVSVKVAILRNIIPFSMYYHSKNEHEIHASDISARDDLGIALRRNARKIMKEIKS